MSSNKIAVYRTFDTRTGTFFVGQTADGEFRSGWLLTARDKSALKGAKRDQTMAPLLAERVDKYFQGKAVSFSLAPTPTGSEFFRRCWDACRTIPRGQTRTYAQLAEMAGSTKAASRAAGQAMRNNPLPVIVPCHRVIGSSGDLHGFSGSTDETGDGLARKRVLLELEGWRRADTSRTAVRSRKRVAEEFAAPIGA